MTKIKLKMTKIRLITIAALFYEHPNICTMDHVQPQSQQRSRKCIKGIVESYKSCESRVELS